MKKRKISIMLLILLFIVICSFQVLGIGITTSIQAFINSEFNFTLNGTKYVPKDVDGKSLSAIIYNDRTYLPVRALADALNIKIDWNNDTKTVMIGEEENPIDQYFNKNIDDSFSTFEMNYISNNYYEGWKNEFENLIKIKKNELNYEQDKQLIDDYAKNISELALNESQILSLPLTDTSIKPSERTYGTIIGQTSSYAMANVYKNAFYTLINSYSSSDENKINNYQFIFITPKPISEIK